MENLDKHYAILGLQRGATQEEIQSAFRQMAKLYHPDQDSSTYAQMRYHEARQAYDALSKATGPKASEQAGRTEKDTPRGAGRYDHDDDELDDIIEDLMKTPEQKDILPTVTLHDYFFRTESIFIIIGTMLLFYVMRQIIMPFLLTDELSVRFTVFTTIYVFVSWLVIGHARVTRPARSTIYVAALLLGLTYSSLITYVIFRQEHIIYYDIVLALPRRSTRDIGYGPVTGIIIRSIKFYIVFFCATRLLEVTIKNRLRKKKRNA